MKKIITTVTTLCLVVTITACGSSGRGLSDNQKAAIGGAAVGAGLGALSNSDKRGRNALLGAAAGGIMAGAASRYGQKQERDRNDHKAPPAQTYPQYY